MKIIYFALLLFLLPLLNGCKKDKSKIDVYETESFPQKAILVMDNPSDPVFYDYLSAMGTIVKRVGVERTDKAIDQLYKSSHAYESVWIAHLSGTYKYFQLASDTGVYLKAVRNPIYDTEFLLVATTGRGYSNEYLFNDHNIARENGVKIRTMESVAYPKHYFSNNGAVGEGKGVRLNQHEKPEDAVRVRWYSWIY